MVLGYPDVATSICWELPLAPASAVSLYLANASTRPGPSSRPSDIHHSIGRLVGSPFSDNNWRVASIGDLLDARVLVARWSMPWLVASSASAQSQELRHRLSSFLTSLNFFGSSRKVSLLPNQSKSLHWEAFCLNLIPGDGACHPVLLSDEDVWNNDFGEKK